MPRRPLRLPRTPLAVLLAGCAATAPTPPPSGRAVESATPAVAPAGDADREAGATADWPRVERRLFLMGTGLTVALRAPDRASGLRTSERVVRALEAAEARLSTWRTDSELAHLNAAPVGVVAPLSPDLARELDVAFAWCAATGGAFDPAVAPLVEAWALREGGALPDPARLDAARDAAGSRHYARTADGLRRDHARAGIEEGAFGKGAGLDAALAAIADDEWRELSIDFGGQLLDARHARPVERRVADPDDRGRAVLALRVADGSIATSGDSERGVVVDGVARSHVLDPRTGEPAPRRGSATVLAPSALAADCLSTACYVLGPDAAIAFADAREGVDVVFLTRGPEGLAAHASAGLAGRLVPLVPDLVLTHSEPSVEDERGGHPPTPASLPPVFPTRR